VSGEAEKAVDWYSFSTGYEAGAASRDAEVAAAKAEAWDEGFDAGEKDAWDVDVTNENHVCTPNPYRSGTTTEGNRDE
jgi:hypothetical protein